MKQLSCAVLVLASLVSASCNSDPVESPKQPRSYAEYVREDCRKDCSELLAGYQWAEKEGLFAHEDCDERTEAFLEGCWDYVDEVRAEEGLIDDYREFDGEYPGPWG